MSAIAILAPRCIGRRSAGVLLREIVILLLVVALVVLVIGAVNQDQRVDLDYVFGTWEDVSVLTLSAVAAGAAVVLGLIIGAMARLRVVADRRKLERELNLVYPRLREAERAAGLPAWSPPVGGMTVPPVATLDGDSVAPAPGNIPPVAPTSWPQDAPAGDEGGAGPVNDAPPDEADARDVPGVEPASPADSPETTEPAAGRDA